MLANGISVIICCFNSAQRIPETLRHLAQQKVTIDIKWEIIIVNNNSTDDTSHVAHQTWADLDVKTPLKIINESKPGLSFARRRGINTASYEYILFCDDDNWLYPNYIETAHQILSTHSEVGVIGGRGEPACDLVLPHWFTTYQEAYAVGVQALHSGDVTQRGFVWGAGMVFRKSIYYKLKKAGFSSLLTDRKGDVLSSGGDSEICKWFILAGYRLYYDENLVFKHFIPETRLTKNYFEKLFVGLNNSKRQLAKYDLIIKSLNQSLAIRMSQLFLSIAKYIVLLFLRDNKSSSLYLLKVKIQSCLPVRLPLTVNKEVRNIMIAANKIRNY